MDAADCTHHARFLYYMLYGEELPIGVEETIICGDEELENFVTHHSWSFLIISAMWQAMPNYHCPIELAEWAKHRQYPYICAGPSESISSMDVPFHFLPAPSTPLAEYYENPLRENFLYTYMTESYALGSSRFAFHNGFQLYGLRLLYKKRSDIRRQADVGAMFVRYVVNDMDIDWSSGEYFDMGNMVSQQRENSAMILYAPRILHNEQISSRDRLEVSQNFAGRWPPRWKISGSIRSGSAGM